MITAREYSEWVSTNCNFIEMEDMIYLDLGIMGLCPLPRIWCFTISGVTFNCRGQTGTKLRLPLFL